MDTSLQDIAAAMTALVVRAQDEKRSMTPEEQAKFDLLDGEYKTAERRERVNAIAQPQPRLTEPMDYAPRASSSTFMAPPSATTALGGDRDAVKFLAQFTRTGVRIQEFTNAMSIGSNPDGGFEVPVQLDRDIQTVAAAVSPLLALCKVASGVTDGYRANVSTTLPASAWVAEGDTRAVTNSPTLAQIVPQRGAVYGVVQASQWVMQDADHDLYAFLVSELGRQFGAAIGAAIISGAGSQPAPKGLTAQTTAATADGARAFGTVEHLVTAGATTAPTLDHCITLMSKMNPFYLNDPSCAWLLSPSAAAALMTQKASTGGSYLWSPDLSASQPPTLFGKPAYVDPNLPAATTTNSLSVWLGAWQRAYVVARYNRPILIRDDVTVKGQVLLYSEQRVGGNMTDSSALKCIKTST